MLLLLLPPYINRWYMPALHCSNRSNIFVVIRFGASCISLSRERKTISRVWYRNVAYICVGIYWGQCPCCIFGRQRQRECDDYAARIIRGRIVCTFFLFLFILFSLVLCVWIEYIRNDRKENIFVFSFRWLCSRACVCMYVCSCSMYSWIYNENYCVCFFLFNFVLASHSWCTQQSPNVVWFMICCYAFWQRIFVGWLAAELTKSSNAFIHVCHKRLKLSDFGIFTWT